MTDSAIDPAPPRAGKRERLVAGAREVFHQQGIERTTLADVAEVAEVPVGNVYYYFKTKDELIDAVIDAHLDDVRHLTGELDRLRTPQARLKGLARELTSQRDLAARYGCPQGSLCSELDKRDSAQREHAAELMRTVLAWAETQFREMGRRDARDLAAALIASYQGISLLANTLSDPDLMARECRRLERWIDTL